MSMSPIDHEVTGDHLVSDQDRVAQAAQQSASIAHRLVDCSHPVTPQITVPFVPEVGQFLSQLQAARAEHHSVAQKLGFFFRTPPQHWTHSVNESLIKKNSQVRTLVGWILGFGHDPGCDGSGSTDNRAYSGTV